MGKTFRFLTGDMNWQDYGGKWYREIPGTNSLRFHIMELMNWNEHESDPENTYHCDLSVVDLGEIPEDTLKSSLSYCGWESDTELDKDPKVATLMAIEACHGAGAKAPVWQDSGNNYRALMQEAREESRGLDDPDTYAQAMAKPVNAIGSTASEYMQGDISSGILRGVAENDPKAMLMLKLGMVR